MSCRGRDVECGVVSCADSGQHEELMSARSQTPVLNPISEMRGSTSQQISSRPASQHTRHMGFSSCISMIESCQDRSTSKRIRTRKSTKIKSAALLALLLLGLCRHATSSSISPILHGVQPLKTERRKNNTGFYYGLRDEHIMCSSTSPSCTLSSLRPSLSWKPTVDGLTSKLQNVPYQISLRAREKVEWMQDIRQRNKQTMKSSLSEAANASAEIYPSQEQQQQQQMDIARKERSNRLPTLLQKLDWHFSAELRQSLVQNLSQSMQSIASQQWDQGLHDRVDIINNAKREAILDKAISLIGGSMPQHDQDIAVIVGASATKSKRKKKKRLNNTGFYYGIREDVLILPEKFRQGKEKSATTSERRALLPPSQQKEKGKPSLREEQRGKVQKGQRRPTTPKLKSNKKKKKSASRGGVSSEMSNILGETMLELREMREEIISLREELHAVKKRLLEEEDEERGQRGLGRLPSDGELDMEGFVEGEAEQSPGKRSRKRDFDRISKEVEKWASNILFEEERTGNGWKEISCNNMMRKKFNRDGRTQVYLKWMSDSRDEQDRESGISDKNSLDYPCIKCYATIDAPMETVCSFLSNEETIPIYNELVVDHDDIEEITPHSKITWTKMPKVLFVKSRDFVTFCSHRWWRDGTQVIVNQACEHDDRPGVMVEGQGDATRGFALRGANCEYSLSLDFVSSSFLLLVLTHLISVISKDPNDPDKTIISILAHANPGGGLPQWAMNTAVNGVVQIEPFKLFHKINEGACNYQHQSSASSQTAHVNSLPGRSAKPAGIAQLGECLEELLCCNLNHQLLLTFVLQSVYVGYTCFWPNGGGLKESNPFSSHPKQSWDDDDEEEDNDEDAYYEDE
eukprot:scaffold7199_cov133-Skeletonema_marinoi.AAC.4